MELISFIQSTFAGHQKGQIIEAGEVSHSLERLKSGGLVETLDGRHRLTELGKVAGELGIQVESVVRIARALRGVTNAPVTERVLLAAAQVSVEMDDVIFPIHRKSVKEQQRWRSAIQDQQLPPSIMAELGRSTDVAGHTVRCKRLSAILMWLEGVELNRIEESILQHMPADNAAGPIRAVAERTRDLVGVVTRIAEFLAKDGLHLNCDADSLMGRLELGIPEDIYWLAEELKRNLERGEYLALRRLNLTSIEVLEKSDEAEIKRAVGSKAKIQLIREAIAAIKTRNKEVDKNIAMPTRVVP